VHIKTQDKVFAYTKTITFYYTNMTLNLICILEGFNKLVCMLFSFGCT